MQLTARLLSEFTRSSERYHDQIGRLFAAPGQPPHPARGYASSIGAHGLSLIELMVVLAVLALLLSVAVPSTTDTYRGWQRDAASRAFISHVQLARTAAIKSSRRVAMCASADGQACTGNNNWMQGWMVFVDDDEDLVPDSGRPVLAVQQSLSGLRRMEASNAMASFYFLPPGIMPAQQTTLTIEPQGGTSVDLTTVTVSSSGRVKTQKLPRTQ